MKDNIYDKARKEEIKIRNQELKIKSYNMKAEKAEKITNKIFQKILEDEGYSEKEAKDLVDEHVSHSLYQEIKQILIES
jgi:hypothetical protein